MPEASIKQFGAGRVTVEHADGHEFEFQAFVADKRTTLFAERWKNRRLPLNAQACRQVARVVAERRLRESGFL